MNRILYFLTVKSGISYWNRAWLSLCVIKILHGNKYFDRKYNFHFSHDRGMIWNSVKFYLTSNHVNIKESQILAWFSYPKKIRYVSLFLAQKAWPDRASTSDLNSDPEFILSRSKRWSDPIFNPLFRWSCQSPWFYW